MARGTFLSRFRRLSPGMPPAGTPETETETPEDGSAQSGAAAAQGEASSPPAARRRRPPYHPGELRRERRAVVRAREERIRDLGGLILEMFRRDRFREDLIREQAEEVFGMETRIQEIDVVLTTARQQVQAARCACGAPIVWGSHFCANCGRPTGEAVVTCANCGQPLPADARFCGNCGAEAPATAPEAHAVAAEPDRGEEAPSPQDAGESAAVDERPADEPEPKRDSWET